jgi:hypothetical protein
MPFATESSCDGGIEGSQDMRRDQPMLKNLPANGQKGYCPVGMAMLLEAAKFLGSIEPEKARAILHAFKSHLGECDAYSDFDRGSHSRFIARRMLLPRKTHLATIFSRISLAPSLSTRVETRSKRLAFGLASRGDAKYSRSELDNWNLLQ